MQMGEDYFVIWTALPDKENHARVCFTFTDRIATIGESISEEEKTRLWGEIEYEYAEESLEMNIANDDAEVIEKIKHILFGILLAMNVRTELIESGRSVKLHKKSGREIWTPNFIGRTYRIVRKTSGDGNHNSPRLHWRRGHFRSQPCGENRAARKLIWLEPMLIGSSN